MFRTVLAAVLVSLACIGCSSKELAFELPAAEPVRVYDFNSKSERLLLPESAEHRELAQWVSNHRGGWAPYFATPPALGIMVRAGQLNLQFIDTTVLAHTSEGVFERSVVPAEYAFLRQ